MSAKQQISHVARSSACNSLRWTGCKLITCSYNTSFRRWIARPRWPHCWLPNRFLLLATLITCQSRSESRTGSTCKLVCVQQHTVNRHGEAAALLAYHIPYTEWQTEKGGKKFIRSNAQEEVNSLSSEQPLERPRLLQSVSIHHYSYRHM